MMETRLLCFSLLFLQLHLLLAVSQNCVVVSDHEGNIGREVKLSRKLSLSVNLAGKHDVKAVERGVGAHGGGGGGEHGSGKKKSSNKRHGALIPVYTAGAVNRNRHRHRQQTQHHSSSDTINCIGSNCLVLILFISFIVVYSM